MYFLLICFGQFPIGMLQLNILSVAGWLYCLSPGGIITIHKTHNGIAVAQRSLSTTWGC